MDIKPESSGARKPSASAGTERIGEIGRILALALSRIEAGKSSGISDHTGETELDISPTQSGHRRELENNRVE